MYQGGYRQRRPARARAGDVAILESGDPNAAIDLNKDGGANSGDQLLMAFYLIPGGQCPG